MALRAIMLRAKIDKKNQELEALREKDADFAEREEELETAIGEAETEEEQQTVSEEVEKFEKEKEEHEGAKAKLQTEIDDLEKELDETEKEPAKANKDERKEKRMGNVRTNRKFFGMDAQERDAFFANPDVKSFLERTREIGKAAASNKRAVTGTELTIPTVVLELIRENILDYSKLVNLSLIHICLFQL